MIVATKVQKEKERRSKKSRKKRSRVGTNQIIKNDTNRLRD